jgi:hypothetical protein
MHFISLIISRRLLKKASSKAAGSSKPEAYWTSTLRGARDRERSFGKKRVSARLGKGGCNSAFFSRLP